MLFSVNTVARTINSVTLVRPDGTEQKWENVRLHNWDAASAIFYTSEGDKHYISGTIIVVKKKIIEKEEVTTGLSKQHRKVRWHRVGLMALGIGIVAFFLVWYFKRRDEYYDDDEEI
jgi:hypothetical protein